MDYWATAFDGVKRILLNTSERQQTNKHSCSLKPKEIMEFISNIWNSIGDFLFPNRMPVAAQEQTAAPLNIHPVAFDITLKPAAETSPAEIQPSKQLQDIFNELLHSLSKGNDSIPTDNPHVTHSTTRPEEISQEKVATGGSFGEIYIIAALALIIVLMLSAGGILWYRQNKLKLEKRNMYPVSGVSNSEYMDPQSLTHGDKLKCIP